MPDHESFSDHAIHAKPSQMVQTQILLGDCLETLKHFQDNTFDLIITSPPYADSRSKTYGGIKPDEYVEWFLPRTKELLRVLKPSGTFILNTKEKVADGERHIYSKLNTKIHFAKDSL